MATVFHPFVEFLLPGNTTPTAGSGLPIKWASTVERYEGGNTLCPCEVSPGQTPDDATWPMPSDTSRRETEVRGSSYLASSLISGGRRPRPAAVKDEQRTKLLSQLPADRPGSISPPRTAVAARALARREPAPSIR